VVTESATPFFHADVIIIISQGATLLNEVIKDFDGATQDKILGVVLYGYNRNKQHDGKIENFPREKVRVFCNKDDPVCWGTLITAAGHFAYVLNGSGPEGTEFLAGKINAA
jgi:cutinase